MYIQLWILAFITFASATNNQPLITKYQWKYIDFDWESPTQKNWYIRNGLYNSTVIIPIDVEQVRDGRTFITTIRDRGVPATLNTITSKVDPESGPLLKPYPDWSWYDNRNPCVGIVNVYRVATDECNRLWVLDTGSIRDENICPAKLLAFDLNTDTLVFKYELSNQVAQNKNGKGLLVTPIVETHDQTCKNITVYMADVVGFGIVIYSNNKTVRLTDQVFEAEKNFSKFRIDNTEFKLEDGVLGMTLSPKWNAEGDRYLFFRPLASTCIYGANTKDLRKSFDGTSVPYIGALDILPSQSVTMAFSTDGKLFYSLTEQVAIGCWNARHPLDSKHLSVALTDRKRLQFVSGMKVKKTLHHPVKEYLLMLSNRFQHYFTKPMNQSQINYRVMTASIADIIKGTACEDKQTQ